MKELESTFLWQYLTLTDTEIRIKAKAFIEKYKDDVCDDLIQEFINLKSIHVANFGDSALAPLELQKKLNESTVAEADRSFSKLKMVKNFLQSTMSQQRLSDLGMLAIEHEIAKKTTLTSFAKQKARKAVLQYKPLNAPPSSGFEKSCIQQKLLRAEKALASNYKNAKYAYEKQLVFESHPHLSG
uniref:HAT C-terminal dimerisation domain-containing protein n=1 Tax=Amphimedon queenslandica TaxID=400682 RepID=A0A1X7UJ34_AMPQE